jgi:hypothetical protein
MDSFKAKPTAFRASEVSLEQGQCESSIGNYDVLKDLDS